MTVTSVTPGQTSSGITIGPGDNLLVQAGGTAVGTTVLTGGQQIVAGSAAATLASGGGIETIENGGVASRTIAAYGGQAIVDGGGVLAGAVVSSGGAAFVDGGVADSADVTSGGTMFVGGGGVASGTTVGLIAALIVSSGGTANGASIQLAGVEVVQGGGSASGTYVNSGGLLVVLGGGSATGTTLSPYGRVISGNSIIVDQPGGPVGAGSAANGLSLPADEIQYVFSGGQTQGEAIGEDGFQLVYGGAVTATSLAQGASQVVYAGAVSAVSVAGGGRQFVDGGVVSGTSLADSAGQLVYGGVVTGTSVATSAAQVVYGGAAYGTEVASGGVQEIEGGSAWNATLTGGTQLVSGGVVFGAYLQSGALQYQAGGAVADTVLGRGGTADIVSGTASGFVVESGGREDVFAGAQVDGEQVIEGGTLVAEYGADVTGEVAFGYRMSGLLSIGDTDTFTARVDGFAAGDTIDLPGFTFVADSATMLSGGVLAVRQGGITETVSMGPLAQPGAVVYETADGSGGTQLTLACFAEGTRIATLDGEIPVEHLSVGDLARLATGGTAPVLWLGHRRVACRRHPRAADVMPVRVAAHAFGLGRPARDLLLSPDHAVFCEGVLIPIRYLLNDATVRQLDVPAIAYWHVELPAHGILLAEGLPAESYLDTGNRGAFANGGRVAMAIPEFARPAASLAVWHRRGAAPLVTAGPTRDLVYRRLLAQAMALGWRAETGEGAATRWIAPTMHAEAMRA